MTNYLAKLLAKLFIKKPKEKTGDLENCVKEDILSKEEMLRIYKDRAIKNWEEVAKRKNKR